MEQIAYKVKQSFPRLFQLIEAAARGVTVLRYARRIRRARREAMLNGTVRGQASVIRPLGRGDVEALHAFLGAQPEERLRYFRPHRFDRAALWRVLGSGAFLNYGLFVGDHLVAYALLKISPTGSAFIGLLVHPRFGGLGLGKFIVAFLYWQASLAGLRTRSTISRTNPASLRSHKAVSDYRIVAELPNDYIMIEFPCVRRERPELEAP